MPNRPRDPNTVHVAVDPKVLATIRSSTKPTAVAPSNVRAVHDLFFKSYGATPMEASRRAAIKKALGK